MFGPSFALLPWLFAFLVATTGAPVGSLSWLAEDGDAVHRRCDSPGGVLLGSSAVTGHRRAVSDRTRDRHQTRATVCARAEGRHDALDASYGTAIITRSGSPLSPERTNAVCIHGPPVDRPR